MTGTNYSNSTTDYHDTGHMMPARLCRFEDSAGLVCGRQITDVSTRGMINHFMNFHREDITSVGGERTNCKWHPEASPSRCCGEGISKNHLIKHLRDVHLRLSVCYCANCHQTFLRSDSLKRHLNNDNIMCGRRGQ